MALDRIDPSRDASFEQVGKDAIDQVLGVLRAMPRCASNAVEGPLRRSSHPVPSGKYENLPPTDLL